METVESKWKREELIARLKKNCDHGFFRLLGSKIVLGNFRGNKFPLNVRVGMQGQAGTPRDIFYGEVLETPTGSRIVGEFKVSPVLRYGVYFLTFALVGSVLFIIFLMIKDKVRDPFFWIFAPLFVIVFFWIGRHNLKGGTLSYPYIIEFLNKCASDEMNPDMK
ncbi:MAG TPA: hypothetical protein VMV05_02585 [bacterium]|nr:hypothetical protein [bacterium]